MESAHSWNVEIWFWHQYYYEKQARNLGIAEKVVSKNVSHAHIVLDSFAKQCGLLFEEGTPLTNQVKQLTSTLIEKTEQSQLKLALQQFEKQIDYIEELKSGNNITNRCKKF